MATKFGTSLRHAWNAFTNTERPAPTNDWQYGESFGVRPDRIRYRLSNERSIIAAIYNRIAIDVASVDIRHVRLDGEDRYVEEVKSGLNNCLKVEANIDQAARHFRQDIASSLFEEGWIAIVPIDTSVAPNDTGSFDILTMRIATIVSTYPRHVRIRVYNDQTGRREELTVLKRSVAIIENPLYAVMNEPNSTLQRIIRKLGMLDAVDEQSASGKLDMIIQLPYQIRSEARRDQAEKRRKDIEWQLKGSRYGIAYTDGTEKIVQLNRPAENNLLKQIEYLMEMLYAQLGLTAEIMNGTAEEAAMLNYINRTIEPVLGAISEAMKRSFLTKTARTQGQSIEYYRDPFKLIPMAQLAEIADKFNRNEIVTGNEFRAFIGMKPSKDPKADELRNSNMPPPAEIAAPAPAEADEMAIVDDAFDDIESVIDTELAKFEADVND